MPATNTATTDSTLELILDRAGEAHKAAEQACADIMAMESPDYHEGEVQNLLAVLRNATDKAERCYNVEVRPYTEHCMIWTANYYNQARAHCGLKAV